MNINLHIIRKQLSPFCSVNSGLRHLSILMLSFLIVACQTRGDINNKSEPTITSYHVMSDDQLHGEMRSMVVDIRKLLEIYLDSDYPEPQRQNSALAYLDNIERTAEGIGGDEKITNFSVINQYMGAFLYDVGIARDFVEKSPPNYFPAGALIKSCTSCHQTL